MFSIFCRESDSENIGASMIIWFRLPRSNMFVYGKVEHVDPLAARLNVRDKMGTVRNITFDNAFHINCWREGADVMHVNAYGMTRQCQVKETV